VRTTIAIAACVPLVIAAAVQVRTFVCWQVMDDGGVNESSVAEGGGVNVKTTFEASAGPRFSTVKE
jgi:hypothetical protein